MSSPRTLRHWMRHLLPEAGPCAQQAAWDLVRSLLVGFTTSLAQLARQTDRDTPARISRQFLARWLDRPHWEPEIVYAHLIRPARRVLGRKRSVPLLIDWTYLENRWAVLQVSISWQQRALPLYRAVVRRKDPEAEQTALLLATCAWLAKHLPGPRTRYVLVLDRGFPSHALVRTLTGLGWRFVLRVSGEWKLTHPQYTGRLRDVEAPRGSAPVLRWWGEGVLGQRGKGAKAWSRAHVVCYLGMGHQEAWFLLTTERRAAEAVQLYRQRMRIECEFRDLKGPLGLDELARWQDRERVARFLLWVAVYEWRLAHLWVTQQLEAWRPRIQLKGRLSWIRVTREWLQQQWRAPAGPTPAWL